MSQYLSKLYGTIAVVIVVAIFIIYSDSKRRTKRRRAIGNYASRIHNMPDNQLRSEIRLLTDKSEDQPIFVEEDLLLTDEISDHKRMHKIAEAEFKRRGLTF